MIKRASDAPTYVSINRNFLNYPIARDSRCKTGWKRLRRGCWLCRLGDRVRVYLPGDVDDDLKRVPTGFEMSVLWLLIAVAQMTNQPVVTVRSLKQMLKALGAAVNTTNRRKVGDALDLLSLVSIRFSKWYSPKADKSGSHHTGHKLLPPIELIEETSSKELRITMRKEWVWPDIGYYKRIPLPLPSSASAQNLIAWLHTAIASKVDDDSRSTQPLRRRSLCRKLGVNHTTRNDVLENAIAAAANWFEARGGGLDHELDGEDITFEIKKPKAKKSLERVRPKKKRKGTAATAEPEKEPTQYSLVHRVPGEDVYGNSVWVWLHEDGRPVDDELTDQIVFTDDGDGINDGYLKA